MLVAGDPNMAPPSLHLPVLRSLRDLLLLTLGETRDMLPTNEMQQQWQKSSLNRSHGTVARRLLADLPYFPFKEEPPCWGDHVASDEGASSHSLKGGEDSVQPFRKNPGAWEQPCSMWVFGWKPRSGWHLDWSLGESLKHRTQLSCAWISDPRMPKGEKYVLL